MASIDLSDFEDEAIDPSKVQWDEKTAFDPSKPFEVEVTTSATNWTKLYTRMTPEEQAGQHRAHMFELAASIFLLIILGVIVKKIKNMLDTQSKRAWAVAAVFGSALLLYGCSTYRHYGGAIENAFAFEGAIDHPSIFFGFWMSLAGYAMSWLYDAGVGRVVAWVKAAGSQPEV